MDLTTGKRTVTLPAEFDISQNNFSVDGILVSPAIVEYALFLASEFRITNGIKLAENFGIRVQDFVRCKMSDVKRPFDFWLQDGFFGFGVHCAGSYLIADLEFFFKNLPETELM